MVSLNTLSQLDWLLDLHGMEKKSLQNDAGEGQIALDDAKTEEIAAMQDICR